MSGCSESVYELRREIGPKCWHYLNCDLMKLTYIGADYFSVHDTAWLRKMKEI